MKITYIENVRIPSERAHAYQITTTCAWMARLGQSVTLINPDRAGSDDVFRFFGLPDLLFRHERIASWDPLTKRIHPFKSIEYFLQRASFIRKARAFVRSHSTDVWYTRDLTMVDSFIGYSNRPWFVELHDEPATNMARWNRVKDSITGFIVISSGLRDRLIELGVASNRIMLAPDGFEPHEFDSMGSRIELRRKYGIPEHAFVLFYQGSFYPWKGVDGIVRCWSETELNAHLVLMGGPADERKRIMRLIPIEAADRIHVIPTLPRKEGISTHAIGDIGLLASSPEQKVGHSYTSPLKLFEYLAAGLPILASDVPSSRDVLTEEVARFFGKGEASFLESFASVRTDSEWIKLASDRARSFVEPYSWERRTRAILQFIESHCT